MKKTINSIAFDMGGSHGRCVLGRFDGSSVILEEAQTFAMIHGKIRGTLYWDALHQYESIKSCLRAMAVKCDRDIASMGIDTMGCNFALLDERGDLISLPFYTRIPQREDVLKYAFDRISADDLFETSGIQTNKLNSLYHFADMKMKQAPQLDVAKTMLMLPDLLNYWLTGRIASEYTIASTSGMLDMSRGKWSNKIANAMGLNEDIFPEIVPSGTFLGTPTGDLAEDIGLPDMRVIANAMHDTASALVCAGNEDDENLFVSLGTWSIMGVEARKANFDKRLKLAGFANEGAAFGGVRIDFNEPGMLLLEACISAWQSEHSEIVAYDDISALAAAESIASFIDPLHKSFLGTNDMPDAIRRFCSSSGQDIPRTIGELARVVCQSIAMSFKFALNALKSVTGGKYKSLTMMGGASRNEFMCQCIADALDARVTAGPAEASSLGNIMIQLMSLGEIKSAVDIRELVRNSYNLREYEPKDTRYWDEMYGVCESKGLYRSLNSEESEGNKWNTDY
jgi:sugar (pentulose or hexulose) kinase